MPFARWRPDGVEFQQPRRIVFTFNLQAARRAAIEVPPALLALADEVIE